MNKYLLTLLIGAASISHIAASQAQSATAPLEQSIAELQNKWDTIQFLTPNKNIQLQELAVLEKKADQITSQYPASAEARIWDGIIYSTDAGIGGGMSALPKVKKAKALLESALQINDKALNGGAHTSLGSLYYKVPGWPIAFGDSKKAEKQLKMALAISPDDIDANYFYGDFLISQKDYKDALPVLKKAMQSPARPGREIADTGRRKDIATDIKIAEEKAQTESKSTFN